MAVRSQNMIYFIFHWVTGFCTLILTLLSYRIGCFRQSYANISVFFFPYRFMTDAPIAPF